MQQSKPYRPKPRSSVPARSSVNTEELLERLDGDREFLAELTGLFRLDYPPKLQAILEAIAHNDIAGVKRGSHALRGALSNLAASRAEELAAKLEDMATSRELGEAGCILRELDAEIVETIEALNALCQESAP